VRRALISDIHGNFEALEAVLDDVKAQGITEIFCLGDIVGGPNPRACLDRVLETCTVTLLGNQDQTAMLKRDGFDGGTSRARWWMRDLLECPSDRDSDRRRRELLQALPQSHRVGPYLFVHGSPRNPISEYVFPEDIYNDRKMVRLFQLVEKYCFLGHTHIPGIFTEDHQFLAPQAVNGEYSLGETKLMINVGSVGQPRDGDDRACYVILEDDSVGEPRTRNAEGTARACVPRVIFRRPPQEYPIAFNQL
jgi:predicted phosphodiesterase